MLFKNFRINVDVIQKHYDTNIQLFRQSFIDVNLKRDECVREIEKHNLIFVMIISSSENRFSFVTFFYFHAMIRRRDIKTSINLNFAETIKTFFNQK